MLPFSTTLVSPVMIAAPTSPKASSMDATIFSRSAIGNPSSMTIAQVRAMGRAPITDKSLIVPETAILPISPPGKKSGFTTCESVVSTTVLSPTVKVEPSSRDSRPIPPALLFLKAVSVWRSSPITSPPAPCIILTSVSFTMVNPQFRFRYFSPEFPFPESCAEACRTPGRRKSPNPCIRRNTPLTGEPY